MFQTPAGPEIGMISSFLTCRFVSVCVTSSTLHTFLLLCKSVYKPDISRSYFFRILFKMQERSMIANTGERKVFVTWYCIENGVIQCV